MNSRQCVLGVAHDHLCDITMHRFRNKEGRVRVRLTNSKKEHLRRYADSRIADWHMVPPEKLDEHCHWRVDTTSVGDHIGDFIVGLENGGEFVDWDAESEQFVMVPKRGERTVTLDKKDSDLGAFLEDTPESCVEDLISTTKSMTGFMFIDSVDFYCDVIVHEHKVIDKQKLVRVENPDGTFLEHCEKSKRACWKTVEAERFTASHDWYIKHDENGMFIIPPSQPNWFVYYDDDTNSFHAAEQDRDNRMGIDSSYCEIVKFFGQLQADSEEEDSEDEVVHDPKMDDEEDDASPGRNKRQRCE